MLSNLEIGRHFTGLNIEHYESSSSIVVSLINLPENIVYSSLFLFGERRYEFVFIYCIQTGVVLFIFLLYYIANQLISTENNEQKGEKKLNKTLR